MEFPPRNAARANSVASGCVVVSVTPGALMWNCSAGAKLRCLPGAVPFWTVDDVIMYHNHIIFIKHFHHFGNSSLCLTYVLLSLFFFFW